MRKKLMSKEKLAAAIREQKKWIAEHGGDIKGYIFRYGSITDAHYYGSGGEKIFEADMGHLGKLQLEWDERFGTKDISEDKEKGPWGFSALNILQKRMVEVGTLRDKLRNDMDELEGLLASIEDSYCSLEDACESVKRMIEDAADALSRFV
jgi:hypothetical protein